MIIIKSKFLRRIPDKMISKYGVMTAVLYIQCTVKMVQMSFNQSCKRFDAVEERWLIRTCF